MYEKTTCWGKDSLSQVIKTIMPVSNTVYSLFYKRHAMTFHMLLRWKQVASHYYFQTNVSLKLNVYGITYNKIHNRLDIVIDRKLKETDTSSLGVELRSQSCYGQICN